MKDMNFKPKSSMYGYLIIWENVDGKSKVELGQRKASSNKLKQIIKKEENFVTNIDC